MFWRGTLELQWIRSGDVNEVGMIERIHLSILREVEKTGTLTAAADSLCLTQSALSHSIKKLERQLGVKCWVKEGRTLRLSQAGRYLLGLAGRVLPQFEHAELQMEQISLGQRGGLRIGMECHPCYQWMLSVINPFFQQWPDVDIDVKQKFQFGGIGALLNHDIDLLVTPDPLYKPGLSFIPVFDYELVLVAHEQHDIFKIGDQSIQNGACPSFVSAESLATETLITYPVSLERLDIYNQFLIPAKSSPKVHKAIETTDIMLQMVAAKRGVTALPKWLVETYSSSLPIAAISLGECGIHKKIHIGIREADKDIDYINSFIEISGSTYA